MITMFDNAVSFIHYLLEASLKPGDIVIDATLGNGWDAALLARCVGPAGTLYGFDIQQVAIDVTRVRLRETKADARLYLAGHETMMEHVDKAHVGKVRAVTFNLGYLPGGDKTITTHAETTHAALAAARDLIADNGIISLVCYHHNEGERELALLREYLATWPQNRYTCTETQFVNQQNTPPVAFFIQSRQS